MQRDRAPDPGPAQRDLTTEGLAQRPEFPPDPGTPAPAAETSTLPGESTATHAETSTPGPERAGTVEDEAPQLLSAADADGFRSRWQEIQSKFVDDPREAVQSADALVAEVMQSLATTFADHKQTLEGQWNRGEQVDTEGLRMALRHYRSFFNRLLTE